MSQSEINKLELNASLVAGLYPSSLVILETKPPSPNRSDLAVAAAPLPGFIGGNKKEVVVLLDNKDPEILEGEERKFMLSLLQACRLTLPDVMIGNHLAGASLTIEKLKEQFHPKVVLLFGIEPERVNLPIKFPEFQIQPFDQVTYLFAPSLKELMSDKLLKSKLWVSLKTIFRL